MAQTTTPPASALGAGGVAGPSNETPEGHEGHEGLGGHEGHGGHGGHDGHEGLETIGTELDDLFRQRAALEGRIVERLIHISRQEAFRHEGATSTETWVVERFGVAAPTARSLVHVAERAGDLPHLAGALRAGAISFDKVRAVADVATPETDRELLDEARQCSVRQLADVARSRRPAPDSRTAAKDYESRWLRFSDPFRTITVQLPPETYAETKVCIQGRARELPTDGETAWDQRCSDAFVQTVRSGPDSANAAGGSTGAGSGEGSGGTSGRGAGPFVVVHVPLETLQDESSELPGELERDGLLAAETVRRLACDATVAIAIDDRLGHTMFEGRARRWPTPSQRREIMRRDRHCRFPGCANVIFTNVHHVVPWKPGGRTDLDNLALLCEHHHHRVHSKHWTMSGDANSELTFVGPTGRVMTSRPSPVWAAVTGPAATRAATRPNGVAAPER